MTTPSLPPADDKALQAAVEALAMRLSEEYHSQRAWVKGDEGYRESWREEARELLSLPAVSALLTEARADELEQAVQRAHDRHNGCLTGNASLLAADLAARADHLRAAVRQTDERNDR